MEYGRWSTEDGVGKRMECEDEREAFCSFPALLALWWWWWWCGRCGKLGQRAGGPADNEVKLIMADSD